MLAIETKDLVKQYKNGVSALDKLNINVKCGEVFSLLGQNGAGKSSLINLLTTYYSPTSGEIKILGKDLCKEAAWIRTQIACVSQKISIDEHLSLMENMLFQSRLYKVDSQIAKKRIKNLIETFDLSSYEKYPTSSYSGGVKRRLDIAMNMISNPKILFLDEPTVGMDVMSRNAMWKMILKVRETYRTTIFLTTHYLEEADQLSDTICIMKDGKELVQGTPSSLRKFIRQNMLRITFPTSKEAKQTQKLIDETDLILSSNIMGNDITATVSDKRTAFTNLNSWLLNKNIIFDAIEIVEPSLEDVFLALTSEEKEKGVTVLC
ncbi:ABC transporter ATP-binding protein [Clostridium tetani]|uniref:ABC transporter ATP-binding protein n=1 Tax=Clostridium tetani TaxID=1513 RepID=A0A4Q0VE39_CLOTA|nr:ABC transporter ATP-binding protein [Clostridium tetani]RXI49963.1 ABC transporter ATP-binding protein [Clostridium tetani]BDR67677.1 ABC transporter ATP-binding protein [Clostridium tetani]BDR73069.1 ABC transporter ATP-binding protein [Clostridium tetani]BDR81610.1 ABC transporter ATP-binding protein [Clostridium tetani]BDR89992.1 ABC transporter ATP-binding protein [Clostridium tetani]